MTIDITVSPAFGLSRPTVADLRGCVAGESGGDPQLWSRLCRAAGVPADVDDSADLAGLIATAQEMTTGTVRVAVTSLKIRLRSHTVLTARQPVGCEPAQ